jgi:hypothetical protein
MQPGYPASPSRDSPPCPAGYPGQNGLDKGLQVVDLADVFGRTRDALERDRLRSLSQKLSGSLNSSAAVDAGV